MTDMLSLSRLPAEAERVFTWSDQKIFARLSGDHNPMHMDAELARRLLIGSPVVHGIHCLLWALDRFSTSLGSPFRLRQISTTFDMPIVIGQVLGLVVNRAAGGHVQLDVHVQGQTVLTAHLDYELDSSEMRPVWQGPGEPPIGLCKEFEESNLAHVKGSLELYFDQNLFRRMFPALAEHFFPVQAAILLATTRLVGMECPGLHSIYSELCLSFFRTGPKDLSKLDYAVNKWNSRFRLLELLLSAEGVKGSVNALVRPAPVPQPSYKEVKAEVAPGMFENQCALIIGGSRGLGEVTTKLIAAGGGSTTFTYFNGKRDAENIVEEILRGGGRCQAAYLDVLSDKTDKKFKPTSPITHIYFFASPRIVSSRKEGFDAVLYGRYCRYYVDAVERALRYFKDDIEPGFTFFYPSTVFLDTLDTRFAEYIAAKKKGEALCMRLQARYPSAHFIYPRLPRMGTDQTQSLMPVKLEKAFDVMRAAFSDFVENKRGTSF